MDNIAGIYGICVLTHCDKQMALETSVQTKKENTIYTIGRRTTDDEGGVGSLHIYSTSFWEAPS